MTMKCHPFQMVHALAHKRVFGLEFRTGETVRNRMISEAALAEIEDLQLNSVGTIQLSGPVQHFTPMIDLAQEFRGRVRNQNVAGSPTFHNPSRNLQTASGNLRGLAAGLTMDGPGVKAQA
jgi:hypothetical protein